MSEFRKTFMKAMYHIETFVDNTAEQAIELFEKLDAYMKENTGISVLSRPSLAKQPALVHVTNNQPRQGRP